MLTVDSNQRSHRVTIDISDFPVLFYFWSFHSWSVRMCSKFKDTVGCFHRCLFFSWDPTSKRKATRFMGGKVRASYSWKTKQIYIQISTIMLITGAWMYTYVVCRSSVKCIERHCTWSYGIISIWLLRHIQKHGINSCVVTWPSTVWNTKSDKLLFQ